MIEQRTFCVDEVRFSEGDAGELRFSGYASIFNSVTKIFPGFYERIAPGAFANSLRNKDDVRFLINHDPNLILARTKSGTLHLEEDASGLRTDANLAPTTYGKDLAVVVKRGDLDQMSFAFRVTDDERERHQDDELRTVKEAEVVDVSAVTFPAYVDTKAEMNSDLHSIGTSVRELRSRKQLNIEQERLIKTAGEALREVVNTRCSQDAIESHHEELRQLRMELRRTILEVAV